MKVKIKHRGDFKNIDKFLKKASKLDYAGRLDQYGQLGVEVLSQATPLDTGLTASSWVYEIIKTEDTCTIYWKNTNVVDGWYVVAIGLQLGHATGTGGWVEGVDYINPALRPIFDQIAEGVWSEIRSW